MLNINKKRNRSLNWDEDEKQLFRSVLKDYAQVIENKCLDTNTNKLKIKAWEEVHKKFNELNSRHRELNQLKLQWKTMKVNARKTCSTFKNLINTTGGGARPTTPDDAVIQIKDLLNPAELLIDHNIYDSDGTDVVKVLEKHPNDHIDQDNHQIADVLIESIQDVDVQVDNQEFTPLVIPLDGMEATPIKKNTGSISAKKVPKRKILNISERGSKSRTGHEEYVSRMVSHSKMLKDKEHMRHMEMAEEEHSIKMAIHKEKLKSAILEREILELKKVCEERNS